MLPAQRHQATADRRVHAKRATILRLTRHERRRLEHAPRRSRRANRWPGRAWSNSTRVHPRFLGAFALIFVVGFVAALAAVAAVAVSGGALVTAPAQTASPSPAAGPPNANVVEVSPAAPSAAASAQAPSSSASPSSSPASFGPPAPIGPVACAAPAVPSAAGPTTRRVPVLMYHLVGDPAPGAPYPGLYVSPASFKAQMQALHDGGWHPITAGDLGAALAADRPVPAGSVVITFDDGYADNYTTALPILEQFGFRATFSVVARASAQMMTPDELAALARSGMEIGNHTLNHRNVSRLHGTKLDQQIVGAADRIVHELASRGVACDLRTFVYPSGHVGPDAVSLLGRLGYTAAFTEVPGTAVIGQSDPLRLPRIRVSRSLTLATFLSRLGSPPAGFGPP